MPIAIARCKKCDSTQGFRFSAKQGATSAVLRVQCDKCGKTAMAVDWSQSRPGRGVVKFKAGFYETGLEQQKYYNTQRELQNDLASRGLKARYD